MRIFQPIDNPTKTSIPLYASFVRAGFPSPAEDYIEGQLDLNEHLMPRPSSTFIIRVAPDGDSMVEAGIFPNDLLLVDRSIAPAHDAIVVAVVNGELTIKRLSLLDGAVQLDPANPKYAPIVMTGDMELWCWGVVTWSLRDYTRIGKRKRRRMAR